VRGQLVGGQPAPDQRPGYPASGRESRQLEDALREALGHDGPALVEVATARHELSLPPRLTYGQINGFTLYGTRPISSGKRGAH
jgi:pyruvate dehydrogenase (quinone)